MKTISSRENPVIKKAISLKQRKIREKEELYLVEGLNLCREALDTTDDIHLFLISESIYASDEKEHKALLRRIEKKRTEAVLVTDKLFNELAGTETPQGVAAIMKVKKWNHQDFIENIKKDNVRNLLVLDRIQDPGNAGTLIRTAEAAGFAGVLSVKGTVDLYSPKVVRSAAGSIFRLPLLFSENPYETIELIKSCNMIMAVASPYNSTYHFQLPLDKNIALVIGNEGRGTDEIFLEKADLRVKIPMAESVESLNAAVAGGILMYETVRQNFQTKTEE